MAGETFPQRLSGGVRRLTTAEDKLGKAIVIADERIEGDERSLVVWSADEPPVVGRPVEPRGAAWWPAPGGARVSLSSRPPDHITAGRPKPPQAWPDINDAAGFHASASADVVIVISGRIWCELDDGVEIELAAGDVLIQNGTRHRWHNHGDEWPIMAVMVVGALPG